MSRRIVVTVAMAIVLGACGRGGDSSDDLLDRMIAAVTPAGQVFHVEGREFPSGNEANARSVAVWIDGERDLFRYERRLEWPGGSDVYVEVGEGWETTDFEESANDVDEDSVPVELQEKLRDPASLSLTYLWILATADEWKVLEARTGEERKLIVLESRTLQETEGGDIAAGTEFVTTIVLEEETLWPVRQEVRTILPNGEEAEEGAIVEFDKVELLARDELPAEFFSRSAVRDWFETLDDKIRQAAELDFTLYWIGKEERGSGLKLKDIRVAQGPPEGVTLHYGTDEFESATWLVWVWEESGARVSRTNCDPADSDKESIWVSGSEATLFTTSHHAHCLTLTKGGTAVAINTVTLSDAGEDRNPFNNRDALISLAEALVSAE